MSAVVEFIEDVGDAVGDVVDSVGDVVSDVVSTVGDVVESVGSAVGDTIEKALDDPVATIAKVAAVATGNAWALPIIDGANVVAHGGDLGDALLAAGTSYVMGEVSSGVKGWIGSNVGIDTTGLDFGESIPTDVVDNPFSDMFNSGSVDFLSAPENVSGLADALGVDTTGLDFGESIPTDNLLNSSTDNFLNSSTDNLLNAQTESVFNPPIKTSTIDLSPTNEDYFSGLSEGNAFKPDFSNVYDSSSTIENVSGSVPFPTNEDYFSGESANNAFKPDFSTETNDPFARLGDMTYGADAREAAKIQYENDVNNINNIRWDRGDFGNPNDPTNYSNEGRAYTGANALNPIKSSPINAKKSSSLGKDLVKGAVKLGLGAAGATAATGLVKTVVGGNKSGGGTMPIPALGRPTYANAPIQGFRMQKMQNSRGVTAYVPFVGDKNLLPIPEGYTPI